MTRFGLGVVFLLLLGCTPSGARAEEGVRLWQDAIYGMTQQQVLSKFPNAKHSTNRSPMADGAVELMHIPAFEVVRRKFRVRFFFLERRLSQVTLSLESGQSLQPYEGENVYGSLKEALSAKYGQPLTVDEDPTMPYRKSTTWFNDGVNVTILYWAPSTINVVYQVRVAAEADKL
jgi:hypothetical protein